MLGILGLHESSFWKMGSAFSQLIHVCMSLVLMVVGIASMGDIETCIFDKKKREFRIIRKMLGFFEKIQVGQLSEIESLLVDESPNPKRPAYRVCIRLSRGIHVPLSAVYQKDPEQQKKLALTIRDFVVVPPAGESETQEEEEKEAKQQQQQQQSNSKAEQQKKVD